MTGNKGTLPPLDYFLAFESAAKNQSFASAARELFVSETAISRKIRLLELHYDVALFLRGHRSVKLTPQGHALLEKTEPALEALRNASREMLSEHQKNAVTVAATNSVAALWLMPKLHKFNSRNKHVKIMLVASDSDQECLGENMDLSILRGNGNWPGYKSQLLFGETIFPVCSPKYLASRHPIEDINDLTSHSLIEVSSMHTEWMNWKTWLTQNGVKNLQVDQSASFNTYPLAIQAAVDGLGIALGWRHLVDHLLDSGELVRPLDQAEVRTTDGYYLLKADNQPPFPESTIVESWLLQTSASRNKYRKRTSQTA